MSAQTYTISGQLVLNNDSCRTIATLSENTTTSGSNSIANTANIPTGSVWTMLPTGSIGDFRFGYFSNLDVSASIKIAIGNTASYASNLQIGDFCILTNIGSAQLYALATGSLLPALLQYILVES
jgi:hypothetical protein